jgi:hypothetical protein
MLVLKPDDNRELAEYTEDLSKSYFTHIFPNSTISIEPTFKAGKHKMATASLFNLMKLIQQIPPSK